MVERPPLFKDEVVKNPRFESEATRLATALRRRDFRRGGIALMAKFVVLVALLLLGFAVVTYRGGGPLIEPRQDLYLKQLANDDAVPTQIREDYRRRNNVIGAGVLAAVAAGLLGAVLASSLIRGKQPRQANRTGFPPRTPEPKPDPSPEW